MKFGDVLIDIQRLEGVRLESIKRGSGLIITAVDLNEKRISLKNKNGAESSRPFDELEEIWQALNNAPAIHVDSVLRGSGTSRNQPETIYANLPYVEWLKVEGKKHIALVQERSHEYGTTREMDQVRRQELLAAMSGSELDWVPGSVLVTGDAAAVCRDFESLTGAKVVCCGAGLYRTSGSDSGTLIVLDSGVEAGPEPGAYIAAGVKQLPKGKEYEIGGTRYVLTEKAGVKILVYRK